jgi:hypothetical protein
VTAPSLEDIRWALRGRRVLLVGAALAVGIGVAALLLTRDGGEEDAPGGASGSGASGELLGALRGVVPLPDLELVPPPPPEVRGPHFPIARVRQGEEVELRESPGGEMIATAGGRTEFGSRTTFWIADIQGDWFGIPTPELPNGRLAWIRDDRTVLEIYDSRFWVVADLSAGMVELRHGNRVLASFPVTVGSPGSPTPVGEYAVTDGLAGAGLGPWYGCCVLALTGHQPNLPANWIGGDRIAIHGTPGAVGGAASSGCLRASNRDMVSLFARVPLGAPVFIRA